MRETLSKRKLSPRDVAVHVYGNSAVGRIRLGLVAEFRKDRSPITTHGRETQVYWKMPDEMAISACPLLRDACCHTGAT